MGQAVAVVVSPLLLASEAWARARGCWQAAPASR